jgi:NAD-dependent SIR2 family protein deacetylase
MSTHSYAPMVTCPHCGHEFQQDDYYEMHEGSELECRKCETPLCVYETETIMHWTIVTKAEYDAAETKAAAYRGEQRKRFLEMERDGKEQP